MEADGLYEEATQVWCAVSKDTRHGIRVFEPSALPSFLRLLDDVGGSGGVICGHNIIDYDLRILNKVYNYEYKGRVLDTLVLSRLLEPERVGGHSIDAWGERLGRKKPTHEDWSQYSREMLHRCTEDVEINWLVYKELMKEAGLDYSELLSLPSY